MQDRERERLFGVIGDRIADAAVLDCFAGTGAFGLESLSRGARLATFVENGHKVLAVLRRNVELLGAGKRARILPVSALGLHKCGEPGQGAVDIALLTPPFPLLSDPAIRPRLEVLFTYVARSLLREGGLFALEHPPRLDVVDICGRGAPDDTRKTAGSAISFWEL